MVLAISKGIELNSCQRTGLVRSQQIGRKLLATHDNPRLHAPQMLLLMRVQDTLSAIAEMRSGCSQVATNPSIYVRPKLCIWDAHSTTDRYSSRTHDSDP